MTIRRQVNRRLLMWGAAVLVLGLLVYICTPFSVGGGGRYCGPEAGRLYRFVLDEVKYFQRDVYPMATACRRHDDCYARGREARGTCDARFYNDLATVCAAGPGGVSLAYCRAVTFTLYGGVRAFGWAAYG